VGKHRRIPTEALVTYRDKMIHKAKTTIDEMTRIAQEQGLYSLEGPPPEGR
jgi:hypothetical protein